MKIDNNQSAKARQVSKANLDGCCGGCMCESDGGNYEEPNKQTIHPKRVGSFPWVSIR